jgi:hypothetical protein
MAQIEPVQPLSTVLLPAIVGWITSGVIIVALWRRSDQIAEFVWRDRATPATPLTVQPAALQQAVFIGFGVSLLVDGLPNLMELAAGHYTLPTEFGLQHNFVGSFGARAIGVGLQMVAGAALIVQSGALAHWLARPPADSEEDEVDE